MSLYEQCQQTGDTNIHDEYVYIGQTSSGEIEMPLTGLQIKNICTTGHNDIAVADVADDSKLQEWMSKYSDAQIQNALMEYGNWSEEELVDRQANIHSLVWTLAWDVFDSENPNEYLAIDELQTVCD